MCWVSSHASHLETVINSCLFACLLGISSTVLKDKEDQIFDKEDRIFRPMFDKEDRFLRQMFDKDSEDRFLIRNTKFRLIFDKEDRFLPSTKYHRIYGTIKSAQL